jgi:hypothetical protein
LTAAGAIRTRTRARRRKQSRTGEERHVGACKIAVFAAVSLTLAPPTRRWRKDFQSQFDNE